MAELAHGHRVCDYLPKGGGGCHLAAYGIGIEGGAHGVLHPAVGYKYPVGRYGGTDAGKPCGCQMELGRDLLPAEEHHGKECGLHEEGEDALNGQRGAEHISNEPGIIAPVGAELELENEAGGDAHCKIDGEELHPEARCLLPEFVFLDEVQRLHYGHDKRQAQSQRHEEPVVGRRHGELDSGPEYYVHSINRL